MPKNVPVERMIFLLHAFENDCTYPFWHWMQSLCKTGSAVLSIEWDGHGACGQSLCDISLTTRSMPILVYRLFENTDYPKIPFFLMGHSFGGSLALIAGAQQNVQKQFSGVIAISPLITVHSNAKHFYEKESYLHPFGILKDYIMLYGYYRKKFFLNTTIESARMRVNIPVLEQIRQFTQEFFKEKRKGC
jgi:alpha-beta hydrolase superfamily lysophospholipase